MNNNWNKKLSLNSNCKALAQEKNDRKLNAYQKKNFLLV